ncbi:hypothetical protein J6590_099587, partial [Homalodisca vitripennis]
MENVRQNPFSWREVNILQEPPPDGGFHVEALFKLGHPRPRTGEPPQVSVCTRGRDCQMTPQARCHGPSGSRARGHPGAPTAQHLTIYIFIKHHT